jgi:hypothetical protein
MGVPDAPFTSPYVEETVAAKLPAAFVEILEDAVRPPGKPLRLARKEAAASGDERDRQRLDALAESFRDGMREVMKMRPAPDEDEDDLVTVDERGDLVLLQASEDMKVKARCWDFFFLLRRRRQVGSNSRASLETLFADLFKFKLEGPPQEQVETGPLAEFAEDETAVAQVYRLKRATFGGQFEEVQAFTDGKVFLARFRPRVQPGKSFSSGAGDRATDPKAFVQLLKEKRKRG